ncbi:PREDICTED: HEAT repeat-containing protein 1-like [Amphimedon queenslandica]|uniref:HEAT repeat-containing protein 1 n=1 Tax=Amphimedon queenslandica TaxID=400682 RepID=A0A1X7SX30_AMPQE|nr:PREDICTED: HEAT repeat-containing protein 1-like [Amphimedon queenslandica]|eukprot:XP_019862465.1 PREDICTED: HEAT repeat-containing protein 1-like [Amphimedon queenslandica]
MEPLVEQITNTLSSEDHELYLTLMRSHLSPCIAQLAVATSSGETQWKKLNQQLLIKTRESKPMVRLCALQIAGSMYSKLGSEVNVILPEIIPFLSELMEDECEDVEKEVQETIKSIEAVTGESVQQYL